MNNAFPERPPLPTLTDIEANRRDEGYELGQKLKPIMDESWHKLGKVGREAIRCVSDPGTTIAAAQDVKHRIEAERVRRVLEGTYYLD